MWRAREIGASIGPEQVAVAVSASGVCRANLHVLDGELAHPGLHAHAAPLLCAGLIGYRSLRAGIHMSGVPAFPYGLLWGGALRAFRCEPDPK